MTNEEAKMFLDNLKVCIDEHPVVADWLVEIANRKTEPSNSEKPNNCEICKHWEYDAKYKWWHCPLQDNGIYECHYEPRKLTAVEDEPTISKKEQVKQRSCDTCKGKDVEGWKNPCLGCTGFAFYEPKDEPQTHDICTNTHECVKDTHDKDEPQTERSE